MSKHPFIKNTLFLILLILSALRAGTVFPKEIPAKDQSEGPTSITSNKMTMKNRENKIVFEGNVFIKKGDLKITADRAEVFLTESNSPSSMLTDPISPGGKDVSRIETTGNVNMEQGAKRAKAQKGVYDQKKGQVVLTGEPEAWEDDYHIKGKVITWFLSENRSLVEGSQVVIRPKPGDSKVKVK